MNKFPEEVAGMVTRNFRRLRININQLKLGKYFFISMLTTALTFNVACSDEEVTDDQKELEQPGEQEEQNLSVLH